MNTPTPTIILQGIDLPQLYDLMKQAAREVQAETEQAKTAPALPEYIPAQDAATMCGYRTAEPLRKYHHAGLTPVRREGNRLFYASAEVVKLQQRLFNLKKPKK